MKNNPSNPQENIDMALCTFTFGGLWLSFLFRFLMPCPYNFMLAGLCALFCWVIVIKDWSEIKK